jgi:hypothetical protein
MRHLLFLGSLYIGAVAMAQTPQWTPAAANDWYSHQPWPIGSNYIQSNTSNQFDMWQTDDFDSDRIDMEFDWAEKLGMNTMRISLQDLLWKNDSGGMKRRMDQVLKLADKHKMRVIFVLLDSCGDPFPEAGRQRATKPGVRKSIWAQSPGARGLVDPVQTERVLAYVKDVIAAFSIDKRILAWDLWNEPENLNAGTWGAAEPKNKLEKVQALLPKVFEYARAGLPSQPLTSGLWQGDWSSLDKLTPLQRTQIERSDIVSFQNYDGPQEFEKRVKWLQAFGRPVLCTGYLARPQGSTFEAILPIALKYSVGAINSGFVAGKTLTELPPDSWQSPYIERQPEVWYQDIFRSNGVAYRPAEVDVIKQTIKSSIKPVVGKRK